MKIKTGENMPLKYEHTLDNLSRKEWILSRVKEGMTVVISTYTNAWKLDKNILEKWEKSGQELLRDVPNNNLGTITYMRRGKNWDCINGCAVTAY